LGPLKGWKFGAKTNFVKLGDLTWKGTVTSEKDENWFWFATFGITASVFPKKVILGRGNWSAEFWVGVGPKNQGPMVLEILGFPPGVWRFWNEGNKGGNKRLWGEKISGESAYILQTKVREFFGGQTR